MPSKPRISNGSSSQDDMPVLKRALQAPPMIDTNLLMKEAYRPHKKFRYSVSEKSHSGSPPPSMGSGIMSPAPPEMGSGIMSPSPPEMGSGIMSPSPPEMGSGIMSPSPPEMGSGIMSPSPPEMGSGMASPTPPTMGSPKSRSAQQFSYTSSSYAASSSSQRSSPSTARTPPPHQLYPQLASALTQPRVSNFPQQQSAASLKHFKSPLQIQHSTLMRSLNEKPKLMTEDHSATSDLLHSIIMNGNSDTPRRNYPAMETDNPATNNQQPLNLSTKIQIC